jgi:DNA-binding NarL/FixJ family response regulator
LVAVIRVAVVDDHHAVRLGLRAAIVAGVDAIVHKAGHTRDLFDAIRRVARGDSALPEISEPLLEAAVDRPALDRRIAAMLSRLKV